MKKFLLAAILLVFSSLPAAALPVETVTSDSGIEAWLVQDRSVPVVSIAFAFRGGVEQDPVKRQGLSALLAELMTAGAAGRDAAQFQQALADHGIRFGFSAERDAVSGSVKALREDMDMAAELAHDALTAPRFDAADIERIKQEHITVVSSRLADPEWQARRTMFGALFPGHPYALRSYGTKASIAAATTEDLQQERKRRFARGNLLVTAVGDITPHELNVWLDKVFGDLPAEADLRPVADIEAPPRGITIHVPHEGGQSVLLFAAPGIKRDDPDWHAAAILDYILGGGGFSSRLMNEVRDKRGLTYGIGASLAAMDHAGIMLGQALTANAKAGEAWKVTRNVWAKTWQEGVTEAELADAKSYLIGALPTGFTSTDAIAAVLLNLRQEHLPADYLDDREDLLAAVTREDIARAAKRLLDPARLTLVVVGKAAGIKADKEEKFVKE
ncbi:MAG: pitrilysin family protein [Alphaproteobacteria bacterium]